LLERTGGKMLRRLLDEEETKLALALAKKTESKT